MSEPAPRPAPRQALCLRRNKERLAVILVGALSSSALASPCETIRASSLRTSPDPAAPQVLMLDAATSLECGALRDGWIAAKAGTAGSGWLPRHEVRLLSATAAGGADPGLRQRLAQWARTLTGLFGNAPATPRTDSTVTATIGIRGLQSGAAPIAQGSQQLARLDALAASPAQARAFAQAGGLESRRIGGRQ